MIANNFVFPLVFAVGTPKPVGSPSEHGARMWRADIKVGNPSTHEITYFQDALFLECPELNGQPETEMVNLMGVDEQDYENLASWNVPEPVLTSLRSLNNLLRTASQKASENPLVRVFSGWEFAAQGRLMATYLRARGLPPDHRVGLSYLDDDAVVHHDSVILTDYGLEADGSQIAFEDFETWFRERHQAE